MTHDPFQPYPRLPRVGGEAAKRYSLGDPSKEESRLVQHVVFPLPLKTVTCGTTDEFEISTHPDSLIRPRRLAVNVSVANCFFLESVIAGNRMIIGSPVDAYHFAPQNLALPVYVQQSNPVKHSCPHCGAPRADEEGFCIYCRTPLGKCDMAAVVTVPLPTSEDGGRAIHCPLLRPFGYRSSSRAVHGLYPERDRLRRNEF